MKNTEYEIDKSVYIADGAKVVGDVSIGKDSAVWYNAVRLETESLSGWELL